MKTILTFNVWSPKCRMMEILNYYGDTQIYSISGDITLNRNNPEITRSVSEFILC